MSDPVEYKNGGDWDDERIARALSASANALPRLSEMRKNNVLNALLDENARLAAQVAPTLAPQIELDDDLLASQLAASATLIPALSNERKQNILQSLLAESARLAAEATPASQQATTWDEARVDQALLASATTTQLLPEARRSAMRAALAAENARLTALDKAAAPSLWERLHRLFNPRVLTAMTGTFAALIFALAYLLLGGTQAPVVARADGSFALAEAREGVLGLRWQLPRTYAGASAANIHIGDLVIATTPVTITFADGTQAIAGVGSQLRMLPDQTVELVAGELVAATSQQTEKFTVQSLGATFVVTDATFRVKVDEAGNVSQFTDAGLVVAMTPDKSLEVLAGEQANVLKDGLPVKNLQPPVVAGQKRNDGTVEFTARTLMSSTVVLLDSQTGNELARFKADENGIVNGAILPPAGIAPEQIEFRADAPDGRKSNSALAVNDGNTLSTASSQTPSLPPPPPPAAASLPALSLPVLAPAQAASRNGAVVRFATSASDPLDGDLPITCNFPSGATFPIGLTEVSCSATNAQGRTASGSFKVSVVDTLPPIIRLPQARVQTAALSSAGAPVTFNVSATDIVDGIVQANCTARSGQTFPIGATSVQCSAADSFGNNTQGTFEIVVKDDGAPVIRLPDAITMQAASRSGAEVTFNATASDVVDGNVAVSCAPAPGGAFPIGTTTVVCTATDKAGNTTSGSFSVSVRDTVAPTLSVPDSITTQAAGAAGAQVAFSAMANDLVDGILSVSCAPRAGSVFPIGQTAVTCRVSDNAGNSASRSFNVNVIDSAAPKLDLPAAINASAITPNGAAVNFIAASTDIVDGLLTPSCSPRSGSTFPLGSTTVTCRVTDKSGNSSTGTFNVTVRDTVAPVLSLPADLTTEAEAASGAVVNFAATAKDAIDGAVLPNCSPAAGTTFPLGSTTVRCVATDKAGNSNSNSFSISVVDTRPPVLKLPENIIGKAATRSGAVVTFTVSAADSIDGDLTPVCTPLSGGMFAIGDTTVTCRVVDKAGNAVNGAFKVTVQHNTPPALAMPSNQTVEATGPGGAMVSFTVTANSSVEGPITPVCTPASGSTFQLGTTGVICRATDDAGNASTDRFNVTVADTTAPALALPANVIAEANNGKRGAVVNFNVTASDRVDNAVALVCAPHAGSVFDIGTTSVTCRATDKAGNTISGAFNVVVQDTTAPLITSPGNLNADATSAAGATVNFNLTASDAADGAVAVSCTPKPGSAFSLGTTPVTCTATDQAGNTASASFNVAVADTTAPVLNLPANITLPATSPAGASATYSASANDIVDGAIAPVCTPVSGATFAPGSTAVTCTATDKAGNATSGSFTVSVIDNVPPELGLPGALNVQANDDTGAVVNFTATANDNLDGAVTAVCTPASGSVFAVGSTRVDCFAADKAGNISRGNFTVVVIAPTPTPTPEPTQTPITPSDTVTPTIGVTQTATLQVAGAIEVDNTQPITQTVSLPPALEATPPPVQ